MNLPCRSSCHLESRSRNSFPSLISFQKKFVTVRDFLEQFCNHTTFFVVRSYHQPRSFKTTHKLPSTDSYSTNSWLPSVSEGRLFQPKQSEQHHLLTTDQILVEFSRIRNMSACPCVCPLRKLKLFMYK